MALAAREVVPPLMTYEDYLAEGEVMARYDILDGVRHFMTNPTRRHQRIVLNIARQLQDYELAAGRGQALIAPQDVLIRREPLRTRQPDVLFISHEQLAQCAGDDDPAPLYAAPELVVEVLSPSETRRSRAEKIADYSSAGVVECWVVSPEDETVEVLRLAPQGPEAAGLYRRGEEVRSDHFPDLRMDVDRVFFG